MVDATANQIDLTLMDFTHFIFRGLYEVIFFVLSLFFVLLFLVPTLIYPIVLRLYVLKTLLLAENCETKCKITLEWFICIEGSFLVCIRRTKLSNLINPIINDGHLRSTTNKFVIIIKHHFGWWVSLYNLPIRALPFAH